MRIENDATVRSQRAKRWILLAVAILVIAVVVALLVPGGSEAAAASALAEPTYPERVACPIEADYYDENGELDWEGYMADYDLWWADQQSRNALPADYAAGLEPFWGRTMEIYLADTEENAVYSPLNVYMALAMLAEITDGNSRQQILDVLGAADLEALRTQVDAIWQANYADDGVTTSILANSLWLNETIAFQQQTLEQLAQYHYAATYQGQMGSDAMNQALQTWLNEQTGGLLEEQVAGIELEPQTVIALASTMYYKAAWAEEFRADLTQPGTFYAFTGEEEADFMYQSGMRNYYWGEQFSAVGQALNGSGSMWFILPEAGLTPQDLLQDAETIAFALMPSQWHNVKTLQVNVTVPKFDVSSGMDLSEGLQQMGITDVFDPVSSDFTPLCDASELAVTKAQHDARVMIDEEGCTAAAYTVMAVEAAALEMQTEEIDFVVDRPFIFLITNAEDVPIFVGVVNHVAP